MTYKRNAQIISIKLAVLTQLEDVTIIQRTKFDLTGAEVRKMESPVKGV